MPHLHDADPLGSPIREFCRPIMPANLVQDISIFETKARLDQRMSRQERSGKLGLVADLLRSGAMVAFGVVVAAFISRRLPSGLREHRRRIIRSEIP
jgi:hypothetical protein